MKFPDFEMVTTDKHGRLKPSREVGKFFILMRFNLILFFCTNLGLMFNPSHIEMEDLTYFMRSKWIDVARVIFPPLSNSEVEKVKLHDREDQPGRFLNAWIEEHGLDATRESIVSALIKVGLASGAKEVFPELYEKMTKVLVYFLDQQIDCNFLRKLFWTGHLKCNGVSSSMT